jgi:hypothetical protein
MHTGFSLTRRFSTYSSTTTRCGKCRWGGGAIITAELSKADRVKLIGYEEGIAMASMKLNKVPPGQISTYTGLSEQEIGDL